MFPQKNNRKDGEYAKCKRTVRGAWRAVYPETLMAAVINKDAYERDRFV